MKVFHQLVFDDSVEGTTAVYTNPEWNELLAMTEVIVSVVYATQVAGTVPTLTLRSQVSGDARTWSNLAASPEINAKTLDTAGQTSLTAWTSPTDAVSGFRRLELTLGGTAPKARLRVFVTGRQIVPSSIPDFIFVKADAQIGIGSGAQIAFDFVGLSRGITYISASQSIVLNPGKTYQLTLNGRLDNFSLADGSIDMKFVDENNNPISGGGVDAPPARFRPQTGTSQNGSGSGCQMIYAVPASATLGALVVKVRVTGASGTADVPQSGLSWLVQEILGGI